MILGKPELGLSRHVHNGRFPTTHVPRANRLRIPLHGIAPRVHTAYYYYYLF